MSIFFTADHHMGHAAILRHCRRPFDSLETMTEALIANHNERVTDRDQVYILGDFAFKLPPRHMVQILGRMRGRKKLIFGNHDRALILKAQNKGMLDNLTRNGMVQVLGDYHELKLGPRQNRTHLVLGHYAFATWHGSYQGSWNLHGHSHGTLTHQAFREDVGVDVWDYYPASLDEILARGRSRFVKICPPEFAAAE